MADTERTTAAPIVLVPGFWLGAWAWGEVAATLRADGHQVTAITLPGLESVEADRSGITFADHVDAICDAVSEQSGAMHHGRKLSVVGHQSILTDSGRAEGSRLGFVDGPPFSLWTTWEAVTGEPFRTHHDVCATSTSTAQPPQR